MEYLFWLIAGTVYGFVIGIIPVAGAATGLIAIYGFYEYFLKDPYLLVVFTTAIVVACTIGDSFSSVIMNIPGAAGSAATMVDGFPLAQQGKGAYALSAAITTSTVNGLFWGSLVFFFLPVYSKVVLFFGIPEMLAFLILAFSCVCFVNNKYWIRGIIALIVGIFLGLIGLDPVTNAARLTGGWDYLKSGIQIAPVLAGFLAIPELLEAYFVKKPLITLTRNDIRKQVTQGITATWKHKWDGLRGGAIGAFVGMLPGIGGNIADWLAYGQTIAFNKKEKTQFGQGNIKGVIGAEGANNAQKATAYIPTVLFGVPAAPFEAVIMSLFMLVGLELGSPQLLADMTFFTFLSKSYFLSTVLTFFIGILFIKYAVKIMSVPFKYYFWPIIILLIWSSVQYTGYWEDYVVFLLCSIAGILFKFLKLNRAAVIIGFVLADRLASTYLQFDTLYAWPDLFTRPISACILILTTGVVMYGVFFNKVKINYV